MTGITDPADAEAVPFIGELAAYFDGPMNPDYVGRFDIELNLLDRAESDELTTILQDVSLVKVHGGVVLDDGNTSDHHLYLTRGPFAGAILFLPHDSDFWNVVFASLGEFLYAAEQARKTNTWLTDHHPATTPLHRDPAVLGKFIHGLLDRDDESEESVIQSAIYSLAPVDQDLLMRLAVHPNFLYAEAVAGQIAAYRALALRPVAQFCSEHKVHQVAGAGQRALAAIDDHRFLGS
ncbi:hypothetical protein F2P45_01510 [Massilia sp. CCM 8733]|uniref:SMI1/KNR4 family protein n=1 Tax=Massilia mucilaginosa TaxID=2609282 RepID=A0ABX0NLP0_9BURK|nr:hypothetical protein [Massilia mucilaginosa]NHZ87714.1 hypothetical protein [Massilia mucilaginosa]